MMLRPAVAQSFLIAGISLEKSKQASIPGANLPLLAINCQALIASRLDLELHARVLHEMLQGQTCTGPSDDLSKHLHTTQFDGELEFMVREGVEAGNFVVGVGLLAAPMLANLEKKFQAGHVVVHNDGYKG
jgi:hypothetical protein